MIRPTWDVEGGSEHSRHAWFVEGTGHCFYYAIDGIRWPGQEGSEGSRWEGMQGATEGDRVGLLLNLDRGSMTVYIRTASASVCMMVDMLCTSLSLISTHLPT